MKNLQEELLKLAIEGYKSILVYYEGSGDSGAIEYIGLSKIEFDSDDFSYFSQEHNCEPLIDTSLHSLIEDFVEDKLLQDIEDWYNDEGGYGTVLIRIPSGEYHIDNDIRVIEYENYKHEGNIFNV
jgi:predicted class III extradiol MEMO1 family dioxygenase